MQGETLNRPIPVVEVIGTGRETAPVAAGPNLDSILEKPAPPKRAARC